MTARTVHCSRLKQPLPGLEKPPFGGELGKKIYDSVSAQAWAQWQEMQIKVLNEYRLNMGNPKDYQVLITQMLNFLGLQEGQVVEVENAERGKKPV